MTTLAFAALWSLSAVAVVNGVWWGLMLTIPAAGFLVRQFIPQHDCGHGALFKRRLTMRTPVQKSATEAAG